jgi:hypothetical protein
LYLLYISYQNELSLKQLTYKIIALIALTTVARAHTISALDINYMSKFFDKYVFQIQLLLKTARPGMFLPKVVLYKFDKEKKVLCVFHTLNEYIDRTHNLRKLGVFFQDV